MIKAELRAEREAEEQAAEKVEKDWLEALQKKGV